MKSLCCGAKTKMVSSDRHHYGDFVEIPVCTKCGLREDDYITGTDPEPDTSGEEQYYRHISDWCER